MSMLSLLNPFKTYITIAIVLIAFGSGVYVTHSYYSTAAKLEEAERTKATLKAMERAMEKEAALVAALEAARGKTKTIIKEVEREVVKEVYRCPVPDDAAELLNRAVRAANSATGQPALPADK